MNYYTTYNSILNGMAEGSKSYVKWLENRITGNRMTYGLDTPIYLVDLLDKATLPEIATLLDYCVQNTQSIKRIIAIELVKAHLGPWLQYTNRNDKLFNLMVFSERYMDSQIDTSIRTDYCGDPIPGSVVNTSQVTNKITEIEAIISSWTYTAEAPSVYTWTPVGPTAKSNNDIPANQRDLWQYLTGPDDLQKDPYGASNASIAIPSTVISGNIDTMLANDPNIFFKQSELIKASKLSRETYYYQRVQIFPRNGEVTFIDHLAESARYVARAAIHAAKMALGASGCLSTVVLLLQRSIKSYHSYSYRETNKSFLRINELGGMIMPVPAAPENTTQYPQEKLMLDAAEAKRYELLHNVAYIKSFDRDVSGSLSSSERLALEVDVRAQMKAAALLAYDTLREDLANSYQNMNMVDSISEIIRPLLL